MAPLGKAILVVGLLLVGLGALLWLLGQIPGVGRLPSDIYIKRGNFIFYFPLATCILISIIISLLLALFRR
jgi:hypothetical protein